MIEACPRCASGSTPDELVLCMALTQARTADIPMIAAAAGFDAVYVDLEHTAISLETTSLLCSGAIGAGITPLVRVPSHDHQYLTRSLDVGAMGVIVPHVETRAEAEAIVDACRFPPRGHRSVSGPNPANRYQAMPQRELLDAFDAQTVVSVMLETPAAVAARRRDRVGAGARHGDDRARTTSPRRWASSGSSATTRSSTRCAPSPRRAAPTARSSGSPASATSSC